MQSAYIILLRLTLVSMDDLTTVQVTAGEDVCEAALALLLAVALDETEETDATEPTPPATLLLEEDVMVVHLATMVEGRRVAILLAMEAVVSMAKVPEQVEAVVMVAALVEAAVVMQWKQ